MSCNDISPELVAYHFGVVTAQTRPAVEEHLLACPSCLRSYLALKREIETAESQERPSPAARRRLRQAVARELRGEEPVPWSFWERLLALGFASAAVAVALVAAQLISTGEGGPPRTLSLELNPPAAPPAR